MCVTVKPVHQNRDDWVQLEPSLVSLINTGAASGVRNSPQAHPLCPPLLLPSLVHTSCSEWAQCGSMVMLFWYLSSCSFPNCSRQRKGRGTGEGRTASTQKSLMPPCRTSLLRWGISFTLVASVGITQLKLSLSFHF